MQVKLTDLHTKSGNFFSENEGQETLIFVLAFLHLLDSVKMSIVSFCSIKIYYTTDLAILQFIP